MQKSDTQDSFHVAVKEIEAVLAGEKEINDATKDAQRRVNNYVKILPTKVMRQPQEKKLGVKVPEF